MSAVRSGGKPMEPGAEVRDAATHGPWTEVLERIESVLRRSLELAADPDVPPPAAAGPVLPPGDRPEWLGTRLAQAEADAAAAEAVLAAEADACRRWLDALAATRQRLEEWAAAS